MWVIGRWRILLNIYNSSFSFKVKNISLNHVKYLYTYYQGGQDDILNCQIGRPLKSMESYKVSIEYDVRKIPAATPRLFWKDVYVQSNSEGSNDIDRTNDRSKFQPVFVVLILIRYIINLFASFDSKLIVKPFYATFQWTLNYL